MSGTVHIIGAGLAGLSAATALAEQGARVVVHEATAHAGGRCRSYDDPALGILIDNGNHIILSGNRSALSFLKRIGGDIHLCGPASATFDFVDLATDQRWQLEIGTGLIPWWIFSRARRVPGTRPRDYLTMARLVLQPGGGAVETVLRCSGTLYQRLLEPLLLATLNNDPSTASARLAAAVIRETVAAGGGACRPLVARDGLSSAYIEPALAYLGARGAEVHFGHRLRQLGFGDGGLETLDFGNAVVPLATSDRVVLAVPPDAAARLMPDLAVPSEFRAIANLHFRVDKDVSLPLTGVINGLTQWIFSFPLRLSVTISNADAVLETPREELARRVWREVSLIARLPEDLPPWQVVVERRATFATLPEQEIRRPPAQTRHRNLFLAGDWIDTGLPPTIEGAVRSGQRAAQLAVA